MKLLIMPPYFFPEQMASTHLDQDRFSAYSREGIEVEVITPIPTRGISKQIRDEYKRRKHEEMFDGKVHVHRFFMFAEGKKTILRAMRYLLTNIVQYRKAIKINGIDVIYSGSTPPIQGLLCGKVKKKLSKKYGKKVPYVYCLQDIFPDSLETAKMTKRGSLIWKIGRKIENYTYENADKIITISEDFKNNILNKGVPEDKIVVIPNWVDSDSVYPIDREDNILFDRYNLNRDSFYICYSGNIGHSQNIDMLLEVACRVQKISNDIVFVIIGEGAERDNLVSEIERKKIDNVKVFPFQPYEDIAHVFSLGDVDLIISKKGTGGSSVPSKTWSIMAAGRPILASFDKNSELVHLVNETNSGVFAEADNADDFVDAIIWLYNNTDRLNMGNNGREYVKKYLSKEVCTRKYIEVLRTSL